MFSLPSPSDTDTSLNAHSATGKAAKISSVHTTTTVWKLYDKVHDLLNSELLSQL